MPEPGGLGVHITIDLGGQARFGPDVEWVEEIGYDVDPHRCDKFYAEVRKYWPGLTDGALMPAYSGIRPKLGPASAPAADFVIQGPETRMACPISCSSTGLNRPASPPPRRLPCGWRNCCISERGPHGSVAVNSHDPARPLWYRVIRA